MGKYEANKRGVKSSHKNTSKVIVSLLSVLMFLSLIAIITIFNFEIVIDTASLPQVIEHGEEFPSPQTYLRGRFFAKDGMEIDAIEDYNCNVSALGSHTHSYAANYWIYSYSTTHNVYVVDTKAPTIELTINKDNYTEIGAEYIEDGFVAYDEYDGDITDKVLTFNNGTTVTYFVQDSSGNSCTVERKIRYVDLVAPTITLNGEDYIELAAGREYTELGAAATDDIDGDITDAIEVVGEVNVNVAGEYVLQYKVQDEYGNEATTQRTIKVINWETVPKNGKTIYLTFDDGPYQYTEQLLDILDKYNVKATFFVIGKGEYSHLIKEIVDRGHAIGIHSMSHNYKSIYSSTDAFMKDLRDMQAFIKETAGVETRLMRFPGGSSNSISKNYCPGVMSKLVKLVSQEGFYYFDWNVDSDDASNKIDTPEAVLENIIKGMATCKGDPVVLQHDTKDFSVEAVDLIIRWGFENGYSFGVLSSTSPSAHHRLSN